MRTNLHFYFLLIASVLVSFTDPEPYLAKRISDANFRYEFFTTEKKIAPKKDKIYYWFKGGAVHSAQAGIAGTLLHGKYTKTFHSNQLAEQGEFENGLKRGTWKTWHSNGALETTQYWLYGKKRGSYYRYSDTGEILEAGSFKNGMMHGKWIDFLKNDTTVYKKGIIYLKKPKSTKEEKLLLKEENRRVKAENKKNKKSQRDAKKETGKKGILEKSDQKVFENQKTKRNTLQNKEEKPGFFYRIFSKKEIKE